MPASEEPLRVAFLAGTLAQGGAEKQMAYMVEALRDYGAAVEVFTLTRGGFHDRWLRDRGVFPQWVGRFSNPAFRIATLASALREFRPHFVQAGHTYTSAYAAILSRMGYGISVGAVRTNVANLKTLHNRFSVRLMMSTSALITNSEETRLSLIREGLAHPENVYVLPNAIDTGNCTGSTQLSNSPDGSFRVLFLGRLIPTKRVDRFLRALSLARQTTPQIVGVIAGDGPERAKAERLACELRLKQSEVIFLGHCEESQRVLASTDVLVFTSDDKEGSPNAILEAMAAGVPVVTTPCGNAASLVQNGVSGFVCGFEESVIAEKITQLAHSIELKKRMANAARRRAVECFGTNRLAWRLISVYRAIAAARQDARLVQILEGA